MNRDLLFIKDLENLEERMQSRDEYEILGIAALLRKLLLDKEPLVDQVNRSRRLKIRFKINPPKIPMDPPPTFWSIEDGLDPETARPRRTGPAEVRKDEFLAAQVLYVNGKVFTVRDIILYMANVHGAVHAGNPKNSKDKTLKKIADMFSIGGLQAGIRLLRAIARVVIKGLQPLKTAISL